jgi:hypothetical protein
MMADTRNSTAVEQQLKRLAVTARHECFCSCATGQVFVLSDANWNMRTGKPSDLGGQNKGLLGISSDLPAL